MAGRLLRRTNDLEKDDLKRVFLQTQHDILLGLARREWSPEGAKWLNDVVTRFMDPLFDALDGRPNKGWRSTLEELDKVRYYRRYVGLFPDFASQYHVRALEIYAARKMALTHILQDLDSALRSAGKGTDADWRTLGAIVKHSQGRFFSAEENIASLLGGMFVSPTLDVGKLRDVMRDSIKQ